MNDEPQPAIVIAVEIDDPRSRTGWHRCVGGRRLRLAAPGEAAAVTVASRDPHNAIEPHGIELTPRERDVLALMAEGASNKAIARQLGISVHTAKFHVGSLLDKLDATGRTDAVAHAARRGVIDL